MLHVHRSHRTEALVDALAEVLRDPLPDLVQADRVMVGNASVGRYVQGELAARHGVVANLDLPYPATFVAGLVDDLLGRDDDVLSDPWDPEALEWYLAGLLGAVVDDDPVYGRVRDYLADDAGELPGVVDRRTLGFARQAAGLYDRYALHRPEMLAGWATGADRDADGRALGDDAWQAALWRAARADQPVASPAERVRSAVEALRAGERLSDAVPTRLGVFGAAALPRLHLELLAAVSTTHEVHLFVPSPSGALWARGVAAAAETQPAIPGLARGAATDRGGERSPLLVAASTVATESARVLHEVAAAAGVTPEDTLVGSAAVGDTAGEPAARVLDALQGSVVDDAPPVTLAADRSVTFHDCHGPLRQVEVLHDEVRRLLDTHEDLEPRDVLVLTPDIATYGPIVSAVFANRAYAAAAGGRGGADHAPPPIPAAVGGSAGTGNGVAVTLRRLLSLAAGRVTAAGLIDLVRTAPVTRHLRLSASELDTLDRWVRETGMRWGRDERDRAASGQPARRSHTLAAGLDRLLVGVAMADEGDRTHGGVVPFDDVEDQGDLDLLGRLLVVTDAVDAVASWHEPRSLGGWQAALGAALDRLTGPEDGDPWLAERVREDHRREREQVDRILRRLGRLDQAVLSTVDVRAVQRWIEDELDDPGRGAGHHSGAVTVAAFGAVRAVPYRVVCLLGMDEDGFPRASTRPGHDLVAAARRPGDPDRRAEDRHLFLEAVLAARDALVVVWTGRDERTGRERPPCVPVAELRDAVEAVVGEDGLRAVTHRHPVLPTSPRAFSGAAPSYDADRLTAAEVAAGERAAPPPLMAGNRAPDEVADDGGVPTVSLTDLQWTVRDPARALCDALRLQRPQEAAAQRTVEPVELDNLGKAVIGRQLLGATLADRDPDAAQAALLRRGTTPAGAIGRHALRPLRVSTAALAAVARHLGEPDRVDLDVTVATADGPRRLVGVLDVVDEGPFASVVEVDFVRPRARRWLAMWVRHLAATVAMPDVAVTTRVGHRARSGDDIDATVLLPLAVADAERLLVHAVELVERGRREVVPLVPSVSWDWVSARARVEDAAIAAGVAPDTARGLPVDALVAETGGDPAVARARDAATKSLHDAWFGGWSPGAVENEAVRLVFRHVERVDDLLTPAFEAEAAWVRHAVDAVDAGKGAAKALVKDAQAEVAP